jgi:hypothetical protein
LSVRTAVTPFAASCSMAWMFTPKRKITPAASASLASACVNLKQSPVSSPGRRRPPTNFSFTAASAGS